jgi:large subunit ribosomal protein L20
MPRSVNSVASRRRRKKILKAAKGYFGRRKNVYTVAKNAVEKAMSYAYRDRKNNKRNFRSLWVMRINAGARLHGMSYSQLEKKVRTLRVGCCCFPRKRRGATNACERIIGFS